MYKIIKDVFFESQYTIIVVFILVGILFIFIEKIFEKKIKANVRVIGSITFKDALLIGITQSMALVPGVSRSGAVLLGMLLMGFKREEGAKYSFMLSLPTIFAASALDLFQSRDVLVSNFDQIGTLIVGFLTAMVTAFFSMKWLIKYLSQHSLKIFGWYRIIFGILLLFLALTGVLKS
jgi:undecaprenyl-diphosphatase